VSATIFTRVASGVSFPHTSVTTGNLLWSHADLGVASAAMNLCGAVALSKLTH